MPNNKILVVGEECCDIFVYGNSGRLCPDVPAPVFNVRRSTTSPGMAANTARNLESLGLEVDLISQPQPIKKTRYVDSKLNYTFLRVDEGERSVQRFQDGLITDQEIAAYRAVVISDYGKRFLSEANIQRFCRNNPTTFLDTKKVLGAFCENAKFIKINEPEFKATQHIAPDIAHMEPWIDKLIVTLGERGCMYRKKFYPTEAVEIFDLCGAGDVFLAALTAKYLETNDIDEALKYANKKSTESVTHKGVSVITKKDK